MTFVSWTTSFLKRKKKKIVLVVCHQKAHNKSRENLVFLLLSKILPYKKHL